MWVLLVLQGVVLALLSVLVIGLLRSHAEILRRLHELGAGVYEESDRDTDDGRASHASRAAGVSSTIEVGSRPEIRTQPGVAQPREVDTPVRDVMGTTPDGGAKAVGIADSSHATLLAFLSSGCGTCADFWRAFGEGEADEVLGSATRLVIVTKDPEEESQAAVRALAPPGVTTLMSSRAYDEYGVPVSPYFILIDGGAGKVIGEGAAASWAQVAHLLQQAAADAGLSDRLPTGTNNRAGHLNGAEREARADAELLAAGITPGHRSLYPDRPADDAGTVGEDGE
jgi:hypothetical protein